MDLLNQSEVPGVGSKATESLPMSDKTKLVKRLELCHAKMQTRHVRVAAFSS